MFHKIVIPMDLTEAHDRTVQIAAELARQSAGEITLLHVIELMHGSTAAEDRTFYDRLKKTAHAHLDKYGEFLTRQKITWNAVVCYGNRVEEIVRYATANGSDLIALTSHRVNLNVHGAGWGTLSYKIGILSQCPVLLVK